MVSLPHSNGFSASTWRLISCNYLIERLFLFAGVADNRWWSYIPQLTILSPVSFCRGGGQQMVVFFTTIN